MSLEPSARRDEKSKHWSAGMTASAFIFATGCLAPAYGQQPQQPIGISGYELSSGTGSGDVVRNVIFAGTTNAPICRSDNLPLCFTNQDDGGTWVAKVDRTGGAGIGDTGVITGGRFVVDREGVDPVRYRITGGTVTWPAALEGPSSDIGCGSGVAFVSLTLSRGRSFAGCLDDTHVDPFQQPFVFPPRIWGTLQ